MKSLEHIILAYLKTFSPPLIDSLLFPYKANRSIGDTLSVALPHIMQHMESLNT